jgi:hypothetical protein
VFCVLSVLSLLILTAVLAYRKLKEKREDFGSLAFGEKVKHYWIYIFVLTGGVFKPSFVPRLKAFFSNWIGSYKTVWAKWILRILWTSSAYLFLSGFFYAFFVRRGLFGLALLLHVIAGGIFAVCLCVFVFLRSHRYTFGFGLSMNENTVPAPEPRTGIPALKVKILFWLVIASGFSLIVSALTSMLSYFPLSAQLFVIGIHRYSALIGLLASLAFFHFFLSGKER